MPIAAHAYSFQGPMLLITICFRTAAAHAYSFQGQMLLIWVEWFWNLHLAHLKMDSGWKRRFSLFCVVSARALLLWIFFYHNHNVTRTPAAHAYFLFQGHLLLMPIFCFKDTCCSCLFVSGTPAAHAYSLQGHLQLMPICYKDTCSSCLLVSRTDAAHGRRTKIDFLRG